MIKLSVVIPVYNEEVLISTLFERTISALETVCSNFEIICVNDGSADSTLEKLVACHKKDERFKVINLSRNFGHQPAVLAGLTQAKGEYIGVMDGDLQDPPELFKDFLKKAEEGYEVIYAVRKARKEGFVKKIAYWLYYRIAKGMSKINIPLDSGDFCLMHRKVLNVMLTMPEQGLYLRGLRAYSGFNQIGFEYERAERFAGEPKYSFNELFQLAYNGIFSFSNMPIRYLRKIGTFTIVLSLLYTLKVLFNYFVYSDAPQGFTSTILIIVFFSGVQMFAIGILGEYVVRTYDESRSRPLFIIEKKWGINEQ